jgi:hypothetical protein
MFAMQEMMKNASQETGNTAFLRKNTGIHERHGGVKHVILS